MGLTLQKQLPLTEAKTVLDFARGQHPLDECVAASALSLVSYALGLVLPMHDGKSAVAPSDLVVDGPISIADTHDGIAALEALLANGESHSYSALSVDWKAIALLALKIALKVLI